MSFWEEFIKYFITEFDKTPTVGTIVFEVIVVIITVVAITLLSRLKDRILRRYWMVTVGILIFEIFTTPMWNNFKLGFWAYFYRDVSWILTMGWSTAILSTVILIDAFLPRLKEWQRFLCYIGALTIFVTIYERIVVAIGIRSYNPEVMEIIQGWYIPVINVPAQLFYYVPVFTALVIGFYKYWSLVMERGPTLSPLPGHWWRSLIISFVAVFMFELMVDPMVVNAKLPSWSYTYRDVSFLMTGSWVVIIWLSITIVHSLFPRLDTRAKFATYLVVLSIIAIPIEIWLIKSGVRVYGPSAVANFCGLQIPFISIAIEVAFAIPLYMALVIGFIRYWERITAKSRASISGGKQ